MKREDWRDRWDPRAHWKGTADFLAYRGHLIDRVLRLVSEWKHGGRRAVGGDGNVAFFCERLEMLVGECNADHLLPQPSGQSVAELAHDLSDFLSVLPETDCWDRHPPTAGPGAAAPSYCDECPFVGPVKGLTGEQRYYGCDTLVFFGWKIVDWRAGLPSDAWPEPGVWYSAFESNPRGH